MLKLLKSAAVAVALSIVALPAHAATLLIVDVSDPGAVTVTATGEASEATGTVTAFTGFSFVDFFSGTPGGQLSVDSGLLTVVGSGVSVTSVFSDGADDFLNLFTVGGGEYVFTQGEQAFSGSVTFSLAGVPELLPEPGFVGRIVLGDRLTTAGIEIGSYLVVGEPVPVPAAALLFPAGLLGLSRLRRRGAA